MLTEQQRELLTAYVDGELSNRQRRAALRLLRRSAEARALLHKLQHDSAILRLLPSPPPPVDLSGPVVQAIQECAVVRELPRRPASRPLPAWTGWAAAASVMLLAGASTFFFLVNRGPGDS